MTTVLVVDDNLGARESTRFVLRRLGFTVIEAGDGATALDLLRRTRPDLALIDLRLPDISGLELVSTLRRDGARFPWILTSGWLSVGAAVEAMRLGAVDAVPLPFDVEQIVISALGRTKQTGHGWPDPPLSPRLPTPGTIAERWAWLVLRACDATHDPTTIRDWAGEACVSYRTLTESCSLAQTSPLDSKNFMRVFRVLVRHAGRAPEIATALLVSDYRTHRALLDRAGFDSAHPTELLSSPSDFVVRQRFIDSSHVVLRALIEMTLRL